MGTLEAFISEALLGLDGVVAVDYTPRHSGVKTRLLCGDDVFVVCITIRIKGIEEPQRVEMACSREEMTAVLLRPVVAGLKWYAKKATRDRRLKRLSSN